VLAAQYGGAIFVWHGSGSTRIVDCTFELNVAGAWGGAVYVLERSGATTIADCVFQRNRAPSVRTHTPEPHLPLPSRSCVQDQQNRGGALTAADNTARVAISNCAFDANSADVSSPFAPPAFAASPSV